MTRSISERRWPSSCCCAPFKLSSSASIASPRDPLSVCDRSLKDDDVRPVAPTADRIILSTSGDDAPPSTASTNSGGGGASNSVPNARPQRIRSMSRPMGLRCANAISPTTNGQTTVGNVIETNSTAPMTGKVPGGTRSGPVEAASFCEEGPRLDVNPAPVTHRNRASTTRSLEKERRNFWPAHRDLPYEPPRPSIRHPSRSPRSSAGTALRKAPEHGHHLSSLGCSPRCRRSLRYRVRLAAGRVGKPPEWRAKTVGAYLFRNSD
jgi:hypothetical protein